MSRERKSRCARVSSKQYGAVNTSLSSPRASKMVTVTAVVVVTDSHGHGKSHGHSYGHGHSKVADRLLIRRY